MYEKTEAMTILNKRRKAKGGLGASLAITINKTKDVVTISMVLQKNYYWNH